MSGPVSILGVGAVFIRERNTEEEKSLEHRLSSAGEALEKAGKRIRLFHRVEEFAFLAAWDALKESGIGVPLQDSRAGIVLGVDEGIDGIRARHSIALRDEGPGGVSPISFPFTSHNAVTAQVSIGLDIQGESFTYCMGSLSGAAALGAAKGMLLEGRASMVLAGGATSIEREFLEGMRLAGLPNAGAERGGACLLLLGFPGAEYARGGGLTELIGYGVGFGEDSERSAVGACLSDAGVSFQDIRRVWRATTDVSPSWEEWRKGETGPAIRTSSFADMHSASFPLAVAEAIGEAGRGSGRIVLIVGGDCLAGSAAALVKA